MCCAKISIGITQGDCQRESTVSHLLDTMVHASEPFSPSRDSEKADLFERFRLHFQEEIYSCHQPDPQASATCIDPVMEDIMMSDALHATACLPTHDPPLTTSTAKLNHTLLIHTPCFPSLDQLWLLMSAFQTSIYSSPS